MNIEAKFIHHRSVLLNNSDSPQILFTWQTFTKLKSDEKLTISTYDV